MHILESLISFFRSLMKMAIKISKCLNSVTNRIFVIAFKVMEIFLRFTEVGKQFHSKSIRLFVWAEPKTFLNKGFYFFLNYRYFSKISSLLPSTLGQRTAFTRPMHIYMVRWCFSTAFPMTCYAKNQQYSCHNINYFFPNTFLKKI